MPLTSGSQSVRLPTGMRSPPSSSTSRNSRSPIRLVPSATIRSIRFDSSSVRAVSRVSSASIEFTRSGMLVPWILVCGPPVVDSSRRRFWKSGDDRSLLWTFECQAEADLLLRFTLPKGAYATNLLREVVKSEVT